MVRLTASYAATDGSCPESVEIDWDDNTAPPTADDLVRLIDALASVPRRYEMRLADTP
jgi:hypothetical protein